MADEMRGCLAATVKVLCVHCLCQISGWKEV